VASGAEFPRNQEESHEPEGEEEHVEDVGQRVIDKDAVDGLPEVFRVRRLNEFPNICRKLDLSFFLLLVSGSGDTRLDGEVDSSVYFEISFWCQPPLVHSSAELRCSKYGHTQNRQHQVVKHKSDREMEPTQEDPEGCLVIGCTFLWEVISSHPLSVLEGQAEEGAGVPAEVGNEVGGQAKHEWDGHHKHHYVC